MALSSSFLMAQSQTGQDGPIPPTPPHSVYFKSIPALGLLPTSSQEQGTGLASCLGPRFDKHHSSENILEWPCKLNSEQDIFFLFVDSEM